MVLEHGPTNIGALWQPQRSERFFHGLLQRQAQGLFQLLDSRLQLRGQEPVEASGRLRILLFEGNRRPQRRSEEVGKWSGISSFNVVCVCVFNYITERERECVRK